MKKRTILFLTSTALSFSSVQAQETLTLLNSILTTPDDLEGQNLLNELREGGYVIYFRHTEANVGSDESIITVGDCSTQRNMSDNGRVEAQTIGEAFRTLGIQPALPVLSSEFCRSRETAEIAFGAENVQLVPELTGFPYMDYQDLTDEVRAERRLVIERIFSTPPAAGTNTVLVAHGFFDNDGFGRIPNGGAIILRPLGLEQGYDLVARVLVSDWNTLGAAQDD